MQHHNYSLSDIENMLPWERDIYVDMLITYIKEENDKIKRRKHCHERGNVSHED